MKISERITLGFLFGAAGGFFGWLIADPVLRLVHDLEYNPKTGRWTEYPTAPWQDALFPVIVALGIVLGLAVADTVRSGSRQRFWRDAGIACAVGLAAGVLGNHLGNLALTIALGGKSLKSLYLAMYHGDYTVLPRLMIGRSIGWAMIGGFLGVAGGMARDSTRKMKHGVIGGLVGGFLGGLIFEPFAQAFGSGMASRLISLSVIGGSLGASIALVEDLFKQAWVVVLVGRNEGRQVILTKDESTLGRSELGDVGIYGDRTVEPHHATIRKESAGYVLVDASGAGIMMGGQRITRAALRDGDVFQLGDTKIEFHEKASRSPIAPPAEVMPEPAVATPPMPSNICPFCGQAKDPSTGACACSVPAQAPVMSMAPQASGEIRLMAVAGPLMGQSFALGAGGLRIGRELGREICLQSDGTVSRRHAVITSQDGAFMLQDEGSSNGTFVNGTRVSAQPLRPGDEIRIGESVFRVEA